MEWKKLDVPTIYLLLFVIYSNSLSHYFELIMSIIYPIQFFHISWKRIIVLTPYGNNASF